MKITSLAQLKAWNKAPTEEAPILMEWLMDWFFEELLDKGRTEEALEAREEFIHFTELCEKMTRSKAEERVDSNLHYYSGYASTRWRPAWLELKKQIELLDQTA